ncbi:hypothetical protein DL98DRAFT_608507 [Cadophora sp. DSE1049]|nr:hypothetical protein DL98DRAFT_608507 [Cadophora sp. DSE1049]
MKYTSIPAIFNSLMLSLAIVVTAAPTISTSETPSPLDIVNTTTPDISTISSRDYFGLEYLDLGNGISFQPCFPNRQQPNMCTVSFIERPDWNSEVQLFIYDNERKRIGENYHVPRNLLAAKWGWGMSSELPKYLVLSIARNWEPSQSNGVKLDYGDAHFKPFVKSPFPPEFTTKGHMGPYTVFRAAFPRW